MFSCIKQHTTVNNIHLALSFMVFFTAYNTQTHIQKTLTVSIQNENPSYYADGYVCFGIVFSFVAATMWISPSFILLFGIKSSMIFGGFCYLSFVTFCYFEISWLTYLGCAITGFGSALLWTSQATYVTLNSKIGHIYKNIGIFWMILEISFIIGNLFTYYKFNDPDELINRSLRRQIALVLMGIILFSLLMLSVLRRPLRENGDARTHKGTVSGEIKKTFRICTSKNILICFVPFFYCGINMTYMSIIAASTGFSGYLSRNSKSLAPLSGVFQGIGEVLGSSFSLYLNGRKFFKLGLIPIASLVNITAYVISFLGLPADSNYKYTDKRPLIELSVNDLLLANVLIGIGDACIHIELYNYIGSLFPNDSGSGFAVFKFVRCVGLAISFYYGNLISLHSQLLVLAVLSLMTTFLYNCANKSPTLKTATEKTENCQQPTATEQNNHHLDIYVSKIPPI